MDFMWFCLVLILGFFVLGWTFHRVIQFSIPKEANFLAGNRQYTQFINNLLENIPRTTEKNLLGRLDFYMEQLSKLNKAQLINLKSYIIGSIDELKHSNLIFSMFAILLTLASFLGINSIINSENFARNMVYWVGVNNLLIPSSSIVLAIAIISIILLVFYIPCKVLYILNNISHFSMMKEMIETILREIPENE